ncbi:hypothetical protein NOF04DRAFT_21667 [Fusarium oxysporum II5]|uniref:Uncharacterized protein n=3 Tax=Fusarium oxysporum species complex TaxID=171631 RepID=N1RKS5_FUSC4|nr:uncharacterized protein FOIG_06387 [Fusarium odoratissimum NRRL 54006]EMT66126.1 hypothetical protein FOC4_g10006515 [Fusarium odoratissimum]EXM02081.1 hypothetical protein FOIG_06387 [Fusarium odoratissimum NRRL 54006]KAK2133848.1 hypothetical protein NOF04DRAFT_21667 [Fusarium oxysporum II5]TXC07136.1 hypothetical protein FocTR4_00004085 [Fusarium oxysporum f. sp. cubense]
MTTNSFGSALPRFDFPRQPAAPKFTAQAARAFPTVAIVATAAAYYYTYYYAPSREYHMYTHFSIQNSQMFQSTRSTKPKAEITPSQRMEEIGLWWTAY